MATCPACGQENPAGARFCNSCGAALEVGGEVRKTVTVLFADVSGSTALGEQLDPESLRRVLARYFEAAKAAIAAHGGTVEKFVGDAVMAVFGVPTVHEDDALRAVRAAVGIRDALGDLNTELERDYGISLAARIGVNTGEVVAGTAERLVTGDAVNVAARLQQSAEPGQILVGERTRELTRDAIEAELLAPLELKGKSERLAPYRLVRVLEGAEGIERRLDAPLVGRRRELDAVRAAFDASVAERRCRLVTVLGPPGIGKTRLGREATAMLAADATALAGRCLPYGEGITYWPLREIFAAAGAEEELSAAIAADAPDDVFWAVRKALESRARDRPLALVVEDIHWAEPTLLELLEHLHDWTRDAPVLLLCLSRPELIGERPAWPGEMLTLEPLSESESEQLIEALLGKTDLDANARAHICNVAGGNPLFVEQLLANLAEGADAARVPATIHALLAARLDALPDEEHAVLERGAVIGLEFEWDALAHLAADGRRPSGSVLSSLVRKDLIRPHEAIPDTFTFRHMLIRDAAYDRLAKTARADLHERAANWMDGRGEEFDEIVGYHLEQAYRCLADLGPADARAFALAGRAGERLGRTGRRAFARGDMPAAVSLLERALALPSQAQSERVELLTVLGRALVENGDWTRANEVFSEAVTGGEGAAAAHAAVELSQLHLDSDPEATHARVRAELEGPLRTFEASDDRAGLARALTLAGLLRFYQGEAAAAMDEVRRAARYAEEAGDRTQQAQSLAYALNIAIHGPTPVEEALALVAETRARLRGNRRFEASALGSKAALEAMRGHFDEARANAAEASALARELGTAQTLAVRIAWAHGYIGLVAGDPAAAAEVLRPACEQLVQMGDVGHLTSSAPELVEALLGLGRPEEAWRWLDAIAGTAIDDDLDAQMATRSARARLLAQQGELDEAERLAREAAAFGARSDYLVRHARVLTVLASVLRLQGRAAEADDTLDHAVRLYERKGHVAAVRALRGSISEPV